MKKNAIFIAGLAHAYPPYSFRQQDFEDLVKTLYPLDYKSLGYVHPTGAVSTTLTSSDLLSLQKLLRVNGKTQIHSRRTLFNFSTWTEADAAPPSINELSHIFRTEGINLATSACIKAMTESNVLAADITHVVAVTCTDQGNPGYDLLLCQELKLDPRVQRTLLHGVGCAGGLSALRAAANIAAAESQKRRSARILVIACELCSLFLRAELEAATQDGELHIAPAIFSDAAASLVVCNSLAMKKTQTPIYELQEWGSTLVPQTMRFMSYEVKSNGKWPF